DKSGGSPLTIETGSDFPIGISILLLALTDRCFADEPPVRHQERDEPHPFLAEGWDGLIVGLNGRRAVRAGLEVLKRWQCFRRGGGRGAGPDRGSGRGPRPLRRHPESGRLRRLHLEGPLLECRLQHTAGGGGPSVHPTPDDEGLNGVPSGRTALV